MKVSCFVTGGEFVAASPSSKCYIANLVSPIKTGEETV